MFWFVTVKPSNQKTDNFSIIKPLSVHLWLFSSLKNNLNGEKTLDVPLILQSQWIYTAKKDCCHINSLNVYFVLNSTRTVIVHWVTFSFQTPYLLLVVPLLFGKCNGVFVCGKLWSFILTKYNWYQTTTYILLWNLVVWWEWREGEQGSYTEWAAPWHHNL